MRKAVRYIPVGLFLVLDIVFAIIAWNSDGANRFVFLALHFLVLFALGAIIILADRKENKAAPAAGLPKYWRSYLDARLPDIRERDMETGNHGDSFIFITDLHYDANDGYSADAAEYIMERSSVSKVIIGGDICNGSSGGKQVCIDQILNCRNAFRKINPYYLRGNHDNNTEITDRTAEKTISDSELYGMILKPIEDRIVCDRELHYYFNNETQKIRYICLDTGHPDPYVIDDGQITWMQDRIRELPEGWTAVVLTHQFYDSDGSRDGNAEKIIAGLDAIYDEADAAIACVVCGHSHVDIMETTAKGYPVICTTCDARGGECGGLKRWFHTFTEHAFDVIHIDTAARKIHVTRIGAGADREAAY